MRIVDNMLDESSGIVNEINVEENTYPEYIVVGKTMYPEDIFTDAYGYKKIKEKYGTKDKTIALPIFLDLSQSGNIMLEYDNNKRENAIEFTHRTIWDFIAAIPVLKRFGKEQFVKRIKKCNPDAANVDEHHWVRPFPQTFLDAIENKTEFTQNTGYK